MGEFGSTAPSGPESWWGFQALPPPLRGDSVAPGLSWREKPPACHAQSFHAQLQEEMGCQGLAIIPASPGADSLSVPLFAPPDGWNPARAGDEGSCGVFRSSSPSSATTWAGNPPLLSLGMPPQVLCPALLAELLETLIVPHHPWLCCQRRKPLWPSLLDVAFAVTAAPEDEGTSSLTTWAILELHNSPT